MKESDFPPRLRSRLHPLSILGALVVGGYPGDSKVRKGFGVVVLLVAAIGALWRDKVSSTDYDRKALERERTAHAENVAVAITSMAAVAESVDKLAVTMAQEHASAETFRQAWFSTMGHQRPQPKRVESKPVEPSR